jgi:hypothetical protein
MSLTKRGAPGEGTPSIGDGSLGGGTDPTLDQSPTKLQALNWRDYLDVHPAAEMTYGHADLTKYNAAKRALAAAISIDEVKDIRDKAAAMRLYAMQAKDRVLIDQATEIRLRAERRAGEILAEMADRGERHRRGDSNQHAKSQAATLQNLDINKSQSSRWQKLAEIEEDDFEELVINAKEKACGAVDRAQQPKPEPKPKPAKKDTAGIIATCVREVEAIVRAAVSGMDAEERAGLANQVVEAVRAIMVAAAHADADKHDNALPDPGPDVDRWTEH